MNLKTEIWNGCKIRFVERTPGDWWAVAVDVAKALAYAHTPHLLRRIQAEDKDVRQVDTLGGAQELVIISEDGIYDAIWGSHKAEAKVFRKWAKSIFKALRQASGLEGFQIFRTLDKAYQREEMARLNQGLHNPVQVDFIKANTIANKATASLFGFPKSIKKGDMTPEMLVARQPVLDDTVNLMVANDSFRLGLSVSEQVYDKYLHPDSQRKKTGA